MVDFVALQARFPADAIEWRLSQVGETNGRTWALCLAYVTNRAIQARLDEVVGPEGWKNEFVPGPGGGVMCGLSIRVGDTWVTKWDGAENTDIEGVKGGLSGAMKRAAVQWGIGRYLYDLDETFANIHRDGRLRGKGKDGKPFRWDPPELPAWALPGGAETGAAATPQRETVPVAAAARHTPEHEAMLHFVRTAGPMVGERAEIRIQRKTRNLKEFVRENWAAIKEQPRVARAVVQAMEEATGLRFQAEPAPEMKSAA